MSQEEIPVVPFTKPVVGTVVYKEATNESKIAPFSTNKLIDVEELIGPFNELLQTCEDHLQELSKVFKTKEEGTSVFNNLYIPESIILKSTVTKADSNEGDFNLKRPSGPVKVNYKKFTQNVYLDRVWIDAVDAKAMLKYPEQSKVVLKDLARQAFEAIVKDKNLKTEVNYSGRIATIKRPVMANSYCSNYDDLYVEIRFWSDATELPEGILDEQSNNDDGKSSETGEETSACNQ